ncbi:hypothetical protein R3W88_016260 [Solanum pinnatisectum]|uniref:Uncharacterized protein n=1 Tax=Solanum pinnatisectum TaxID=50273 RepID=A0AAV9KWW8_9SOLN|nr:hypothetical protein R3W88_016260 [Solanum pinnatisectum]
MSILVKHFKKFLRKKENEKKETSNKKWLNYKSQFGCYKFEWRKERAEKKLKEKEKCAMVATWGLGTEEFDEEVDEISLRVIRDSDMEEGEANFERSILDLKEKLHLFPKRKLISMMKSLINDLQELTMKDISCSMILHIKILSV